MDAVKIREYAALMKELGLTGIEVNEKKGIVRLERNPCGQEVDRAASRRGLSLDAAGIPGSARTEEIKEAGTLLTMSREGSCLQAEGGEVQAAAYPDPVSDAAGSPGSGGAAYIFSPMVGIFYTSPAQNREPYVRTGETVKKGQVIGIIESMKLMNEIQAEQDCVIEKLCVKDGAPVEYGTPLFQIRIGDS